MTAKPKQNRAVAYARMSTDRQTLSIAQQLAAIGVYAETHDLEITRTFLDEGKSGLALQGRTGLRALLAEVVSGAADFGTVLVLDVSRWGRFQDVDESAHYEFLCRQAGVKIIYCAEPFSQDGSPLASVIKGMKRAMAAEYSRELSTKVHAAHCRIFASGYKAGGKPGYGFRRAAFSASGEHKQNLRDGERKPAISDRVKIIAGKTAEAEVVRRIYQLFLNDRLGDTAIARLLNSEGVPNDRGSKWNPNAVKYVLTSPKYCGVMRFNQTSQRLATRKVQNPSSLWINVKGAFDPIVPEADYLAAQAERARRRQTPTDKEILEHIRRLYLEQGRVDAKLISKARLGLTHRGIIERFGGLTAAYVAAGIPTSNAMVGAQLRSAKCGMVSALLKRVTVLAETRGATWTQLGRSPVIEINDSIKVKVAIACSNHARAGRVRWRMRLRDRNTADYVLCARLDVTNTAIQDYWLIPVWEYCVVDLWLAPHLIHVNSRHQFTRLEEMFEL